MADELYSAEYKREVRSAVHFTKHRFTGADKVVIADECDVGGMKV
jgi:hypothetical protein